MTAATLPQVEGSAVTEGFPKAAGLQDLLAPGSQATTPAPAQPPANVPDIPPVVFGPGLFLNALRLLDKLASKLLKVEPEEPKTVEELAGALAPLVQYYGRSNSTVAALWGNVIISLLAVGYAKAEKVKARQPQEGSSHGVTES